MSDVSATNTLFENQVIHPKLAFLQLSVSTGLNIDEVMALVDEDGNYSIYLFNLLTTINNRIQFLGSAIDKIKQMSLRTYIINNAKIIGAAKVTKENVDSWLSEIQ